MNIRKNKLIEISLILGIFLLIPSCTTNYNSIELSNEVVTSKNDSWESMDIQMDSDQSDEDWWNMFP